MDGNSETLHFLMQWFWQLSNCDNYLNSRRCVGYQDYIVPSILDVFFSVILYTRVNQHQTTICLWTPTTHRKMKVLSPKKMGYSYKSHKMKETWIFFLVGECCLELFPSIQLTQIQVVFSFSLPMHRPQVDKDLSVCPKLLGVFFCSKKGSWKKKIEQWKKPELY